MGNWEASWIDTCPVIKKTPFLRCDNDSFTFYTSHNYIRCIYLYIPVLIIIWNDRCHITTCINQICVTSKKSNVNCFDDTEKSVFWFEFLSFYLNERRTNKGYNCQDLKKNMEHQTNFVICLLNSFFVTRKAENKKLFREWLLFIHWKQSFAIFSIHCSKKNFRMILYWR